ncbi:glycosyltransferase 61 family protein [uncultured Aureimonas sp.]|uniref:glycosyltransferase 61 family protein n=1 Tax=uncultured Aureimonas sp. TaxID=1604662 RepID=UPI0025D297A0|nr:glycosyltransferase 61 family protein [uncultured Aureimonas sp.]
MRDSRWRGLLGETFLERWLEEAGVKAFYPETHCFSEQMDFYRKAECVIFAQGSACHGTELLGRRGLEAAILIPKSIKSDFFRRILSPRARRFCVAGAPNQIGTMYYHPQTRFQYVHLDVSLVDYHALADCLLTDEIRPPPIKPWTYRLAAARDLRRYIREAFRAKGADYRQATRLVMTFLMRVFGTVGTSSN